MYHQLQVEVVVHLGIAEMDVDVVVVMDIIVVVVVEIGIVVRELVSAVISIVMDVASIRTTLEDADTLMSVRYVTVIIPDHSAVKELKQKIRVIKS